MNVLTSTKNTQGHRDSDFSWVPEGELVAYSVECETDKNDIDGPCGCRRSLSGLKTRKATTTFRVSTFDSSEDDWLDLVRESNRQAGWGDDLEFGSRELLDIAARYSLGTILEKRGDVIQQRAV